MKKTLIFALVVVLAASLSASAATIVGSKHDLGNGGSSTFKATQTTQVCAFCHVPHNAYTGTAAGGGTNQLIPLWSHTKTATAAFTLYTSPTGTLQATMGQPTGVSLACLSCHDGTIGVGSLVVTTVGGTAVNTFSNFAQTLTGQANLGTDLSNDHPTSFVLTAQNITDDTGLHTLADIYTADPGYFTNYIAGTSGRIECSSCHKVHDPALTPFLRKTMASSAMCLDCHIK